MKYSVHSPESFVSMPWKNGKGNTIELLKETADEGAEFVWRISMAAVTTDGEFSNFAGYDRTLVLLEGSGITLSHQNGNQDVLRSSLEKAIFSGDDNTIAELHDGPITDFNIMVHRNYGSACVIAEKSTVSSRLQVKADIFLLYAVQDDVLIQPTGLEPIPIGQQHLFSAEGQIDSLIECSGGPYISIQISYSG